MTSKETEHILDKMLNIEQFSDKEAFAKLQTKIQAREAIRKRLRLSVFVTSFSGVAALLLFAFLFNSNPVQIINNFNSPLSHILPDGSTVELNKGATIEYQSSMKNKRDIKLIGEAFFDVRPDAEHPFEISVGSSKIKVLGTSFNVRHNVESNNVEVFVKTGTVMLIQNMTNKLKLGPSQYGVASNGVVQEMPKTDQNYMAWKDRKLVFADDSIYYVLKILEESYHTKFTLSNDNKKNLRITTTIFQLSEQEALTSICLTLGLEYIHEENGYVLY
jgi:transmembrane sensor